MSGQTLLEPCPFCGNTEFDVLPRWVLCRTMYTVYCGLCATHGPMKYTRQEAESAWNNRYRKEDDPLYYGSWTRHQV